MFFPPPTHVQFPICCRIFLLKNVLVMSSWRFASTSGVLTWTTPSLPDGGTELFSELSPTLIIGLQEQGDVLPVDYIKLQSIKSVTPHSARGFVLEREGASPALLIAPSESEAKQWIATINQALRSTDGSSMKREQPSAPVAEPVSVSAPRQVIKPVQETTVLDKRINSGAQGVPAAAFSESSALFTAVPSASSNANFVVEPPPPPLPAKVAPAPTRGATPDQQVNLGTRFTVSPQPRSSEVQGRGSGSTVTLPASSQGIFWGSPHVRPAEPCNEDPSGQHDYRKVSEITRGGAVTSTVTTHLDLRNPVPARIAPQEQQRQQPLWTPLAKPPPVIQSSPRPMSTQVERPLPTSSVSQEPAGISPITSAQRPSVSQATPSGGDSSFSLARKRGGMLVDVPPNPQANRNIAPNASAVWKSWTAPDGVLYVSHESTGTVQRKNPETGEFETLVEGVEEIPMDEMHLRPYDDHETTVDLNTNSVRNLHAYGSKSDGPELGPRASPNIYRTEAVVTPRGQYSPSRRSQLSALAAPRQSQSAYMGRRVHHITLGPAPEEPNECAIEHKIQLLGAGGVKWDPRTGQTIAPEDTRDGELGESLLFKQWNHVRKILLQGRYFKKHALRSRSSAFRFVFLTTDNAYVVCVPTSEVMLNLNQAPKTFDTVTETVQYYGPESRAIALNTITHVSLGTEEEFVRSRRKLLTPENVFCIVSRTHAFVLECNTSEEAKYFADAWTFFLYHSRPVGTPKAAHVKKPVTFGTRAGVAF